MFFFEDSCLAFVYKIYFIDFVCLVIIDFDKILFGRIYNGQGLCFLTQIGH